MGAALCSQADDELPPSNSSQPSDSNHVSYLAEPAVSQSCAEPHVASPAMPVIRAAPPEKDVPPEKLSGSTQGFAKARYSSKAKELTKDLESAMADPQYRKRIYFIRHAEAIHNVAEKKAKAQARARGERGSLTEDEIRSLEENARSEVLKDPAFHDPSLSDEGVSQAKVLNVALEGLFESASRYERPTLILVSPLERTMQTMLHVFPDFQQNDDSVLPMELIREKRTGRPCDEASPMMKPSYRQMGIGSPLDYPFLQSAMNDMPACNLDSAFIGVETPRSSGRVPKESGREKSPRSSVISFGEIEQNEHVAVRARELLEYIKHSDHEVIAVVTHKAFLRELERGPLKQWVQKHWHGKGTLPLEFGNAEMRIYDLEWC